MEAEFSLDLALKIMRTAETRAREIETPMSTAVVDSGGHLIALHRMDGADWITPEIALGKVYTTAAFKSSSEEVAQRGADLPAFVHAITVMTGGRFTPQRGGLPIAFDGQIVGAIGACGGTGDQDVSVLKAALGDSLLST